MLIIKTKTDKIEAVKESVLKDHSYDVPEFISLPVIFRFLLNMLYFQIEQGSEPYLKWIEDQVKKE